MSVVNGQGVKNIIVLWDGDPPCIHAGKNRPLDEEDLAFVTGWQDSEHAKEQSLRNAEREEVASFQEVRGSCKISFPLQKPLLQLKIILQLQMPMADGSAHQQSQFYRSVENDRHFHWEQIPGFV